MCDESFFFPELGGKSFLLSSIVFLLLHMWRKENIFSRASADVVLSVIVSLRHSLSTDYTTTHIFFFWKSVIYIIECIHFYTKNCGGELIAEIFVPFVCARILMVQKAKKIQEHLKMPQRLAWFFYFVDCQLV